MSGFTALNGGSPKGPEPAANGTGDDKRPASMDRINGLASPPEPTTRSLADAPSTSQDKWAPGQEQRQTYPPTAHKDAESPNKRKRLVEDDDSDEEPRRDAPPPPNRLEHVQERSPQERSPREPTGSQSQYPESRPSRDTREARDARDARDRYGTPPQRDYRQFGDESRDSAYSSKAREERPPYEHARQHSGHHHPSQPTGDGQGGDSADRSAGHDSDFTNTSPGDEDRQITVYGSPYATEQQRRDGAIIQTDAKKRKRNFSNRTKTGCLTCRKRKKKCDEQKPECSNCLKGGFLCAGYPPQRGGVWQKPDSKPPTIPLESKDPSYVPPGAYGMPQQGPYSSQTVLVQKRDLSHYRGQALRIDPPQGRPITIPDDDRPTATSLPSASTTSPDNTKLSAMPYTPANVFPTPVSANPTPLTPFSERVQKDYQRVPPLHDLSRTDPDTPHPGAGPAHGPILPQINIMHAGRTNSPLGPPQQAAHPPQATSAQMAAQLALSHSQFPSTRPRTQKEEMLSGRHYYPFDKELVLERERCSAACWRFNNSTNPNNGVSPAERARLFREILHPRDPIQLSPAMSSPVTHVGRVGENVVVEAPFTCDYGYNITIGQNVIIGRDCNIVDTCEVKIGDNCHIGPNVNIYTATLPIDPKRRMGSKGPQLGSPITIGPDCWIGGGAIILAGRTIGKGSTVGAGAIVTKDVPPFTVVVGNPAKVLRGISS